MSIVKLSQTIDGYASQESKLRRVQRFLTGSDMEGNLIAKLVFTLLTSKPPYNLSMDRTNWKFSKVTINILIISVCNMGIGLPLMATL